MRSAAVIVFIALVAAAALYCAQRPTVARGKVLAADLIEANPMLHELDCQHEIPIGLAGASFGCTAKFKSGDEADYTFNLDRAGMITVANEGAMRSVPRIKKTSDPWGDRAKP